MNILRTLDNSVSSESLDRRRRSNPAARSSAFCKFKSYQDRPQGRAHSLLLLIRCRRCRIHGNHGNHGNHVAPGGAGPHARSETESLGVNTARALDTRPCAQPRRCYNPRGADSEGVADNRDVRVAARGQVRSGASGRRRGRLLVPGLSESPNLSHRA